MSLSGKFDVKYINLLALWWSCLSIALAQPTQKQTQDSILNYIYQNKENRLHAIIIDGDTVPIWILDEVLFVSTPAFDSDEARRRYYLLRRKVHKVYPYAVIAGDKLDSLQFRLSLLRRERDKKRFIKQFQEYLEQEFAEELKRLTRSEGQILCKLIYRETGITTYDLIQQYRGGMRAFLYNITANFYEISLKKQYDPENDPEDRFIENILQRAFAEGILTPRQKKIFDPADFDDTGEVIQKPRRRWWQIF
ncbi:DUF4294 domain-containing protein [Schleiferia thermophila]|jgi:hypothetical protein|uniref:DUF4294 domain-containing protein n=1 Tax=Schleiferia thermophila TaxID=884107 RepID=UPI0004E69E5E|nr:DUF4294 domain-containing protein [Schleiferia thermophila]KFD39501.1 hypothetical protein AT05_04670 [Schleiferia thermophila str. Yellowstone]PMB23080.1 DUF4294 domain-containing protein [Fischerella thermalis CCMEE 5319]